MQNEKEFKKKFKDSVKKNGGYSLSLSAPLIAGLPDLYTIMPGYIPVLLEAKWLGSIPRHKFKRKLQITKLQADVIKSCHDVYPYSAMALIGFKWDNFTFAVFVPYTNPNFESINNDFMGNCPYCMYFDGAFDVCKLFNTSPLARLPYQHGPLKNNWTGESRSTILLE